MSTEASDCNFLSASLSQSLMIVFSCTFRQVLISFGYTSDFPIGSTRKILIFVSSIYVVGCYLARIGTSSTCYTTTAWTWPKWFINTNLQTSFALQTRSWNSSNTVSSFRSFPFRCIRYLKLSDDAAKYSVSGARHRRLSVILNYKMP